MRKEGEDGSIDFSSSLVGGRWVVAMVDSGEAVRSSGHEDLLRWVDSAWRSSGRGSTVKRCGAASLATGGVGGWATIHNEEEGQLEFDGLGHGLELWMGSCMAPAWAVAFRRGDGTATELVAAINGREMKMGTGMALKMVAFPSSAVAPLGKGLGSRWRVIFSDELSMGEGVGEGSARLMKMMTSGVAMRSLEKSGGGSFWQLRWLAPVADGGSPGRGGGVVEADVGWRPVGQPEKKTMREGGGGREKMYWSTAWDCGSIHNGSWP